MTASDRPVTASVSDAAPPRNRWIAMAILLVAGFMNLIDVSIVNVALPSLQTALGATPSQIEWVVAAYILFYALMLLPAGRLGDIVGRRRMFLLGVGVFTLGSAICGLAPSIGTLVVARIFQALGAGMMTPQTLALIPILFQPHERGAAFALSGMMSGLAAVTGPVLGGWLISNDIAGLGWRPIFLVNVPVGIAAILLALRFLPKGEGGRVRGLDLMGMVLAAAALLCVIFPLIEGRQAGWPVWCFAMMAAAVPFVGALALWLRRQGRLNRPEIIPAVLFTHRSFVLGTILGAMLFSGVPGFFLVLAVYLQSGYGLDPLHSGLTTLPFSLGVLVSSLVSGRMGTRAMRGRITIGAVMLASCMVGLRFVVDGSLPAIVWSHYAPLLFVVGVGLGVTISPLFQTILSSVPRADTGAASGGLQAFQQMGGALGVAVMGELFFGRVASGMGAGGAAHEVFAAAFVQAILYNTLAFLMLAVLVWALPRPAAPVQHLRPALAD
jgi:EmrB/QacA subfamily drug resistance transporter